jgi:hypothetical protein
MQLNGLPLRIKGEKCSMCKHLPNTTPMTRRNYRDKVPAGRKRKMLCIPPVVRMVS